MSRRGATLEYHPWSTAMAAAQEARRFGERRIGTDLLLIAALREPAVAAVVGVTADEARRALERLDRRALDAVGLGDEPLSAISLDEEPVPTHPRPSQVLRRGARFTPAARAAMQFAFRSMRRGVHPEPVTLIGALLESGPPDPAIALLAELGVDVDALRRRVAVAES